MQVNRAGAIGSAAVAVENPELVVVVEVEVVLVAENPVQAVEAAAIDGAPEVAVALGNRELAAVATTDAVQAVAVVVNREPVAAGRIEDLPEPKAVMIDGERALTESREQVEMEAELALVLAPDRAQEAGPMSAVGDPVKNRASADHDARQVKEPAAAALAIAKGAAILLVDVKENMTTTIAAPSPKIATGKNEIKAIPGVEVIEIKARIEAMKIALDVQERNSIRKKEAKRTFVAHARMLTAMRAQLNLPVKEHRRSVASEAPILVASKPAPEKNVQADGGVVMISVVVDKTKSGNLLMFI